MPEIDKLFEAMLALGGSDLHLSQGQPPKIRLHGHMAELDYPPLTFEKIRGFLKEICPGDRWRYFKKHRDLDFAYGMGDRARFRANYHVQFNGLGAVFRIIPTDIKSLADLGLPPQLANFAYLRSGLVIVTGPTGSGKSTTLAAIIDYVNTNFARHIVTIEEPIEFIHRNKNSIFSQREVGLDCHSFADGLRSSTRQDCDIILVGEMRDFETISLALSAAAKGKVVFATMHTNSADKTVDRIIDAFPPEQQLQIRSMLADTLRGVCAQLLIRKSDNRGVLPINEILFGTQSLGACIREANTGAIRNIIASGRKRGMQMMDDAIAQAIREGRANGEDAYLKARDKARFAQFAPPALQLAGLHQAPPPSPA